MFEFLINGNKTIELMSSIAIIIVIGIVLVAFIKSSNAKFFVGVFLFIVLLVSGIYSGLQLHTYYSAEGGIYGVITGVFNPNEVKVVNSIEYSFENIELTQLHDDTYNAEILLKDVVSFDGTKNYGVFINNAPCDFVQYSSFGEYLIAKYEYCFLDNSFEDILTDTLEFKFAFYTNSTYLSITTNGGVNAVKYWNYYMNKNLFVLTMEEIDYKDKAEIEYVDDDVSDYAVATFVNEDETTKRVYKKGTSIKLDNIYDDFFEGWYVEDENIGCGPYLLDKDTTFVAKFSYIDFSIETKVDPDSEGYYSNQMVSINDVKVFGSIYYYGYGIPVEYDLDDKVKLRGLGLLHLDYHLNYPEFNVSVSVKSDGYSDYSDASQEIDWRGCTYLKIIFTISKPSF